MSARPSLKPELDRLSDQPIITKQRVFASPLTIGVISDTHIYPGSRRELPPECLALFRRFRCGLLIHAGDANTEHTLRVLADLAPLLAVSGNTDLWELDEPAPVEIEFTVGRFTFGLLHGNGVGTARGVVKNRFAGIVDIAIYGHSHIPKIERVENTILFNPGSATDRRWSDHFGIGLVHVDAERVFPELILYKDPRELVGVRPD